MSKNTNDQTNSVYEKFYADLAIMSEKQYRSLDRYRAVVAKQYCDQLLKTIQQKWEEDSFQAVELAKKLPEFLRLPLLADMQELTFEARIRLHKNRQ